MSLLSSGLSPQNIAFHNNLLLVVISVILIISYKHFPVRFALVIWNFF